jgi:fido (protein-threonine AMPylation protein)
MKVNEFLTATENLSKLPSGADANKTDKLTKEKALFLLYQTIVYAQPAADGNSRTTRTFINELAAANGISIMG